MDAHPSTATCRCGHSRDVHVHLRPGTDCSACTGALQCARFQVPRTPTDVVTLPALQLVS
jgi:hypothetical protein